MRPEGEGQVPGGVGTADVECAWIGEDRGITVGRGDGHCHLVTRPDGGARQRAAGGRVPVDDGRGGLEPQRFLDRRWYQPAVGADQRELGRVAEQVQEGVNDHAFGCLDAAEHQDGRVRDRFGLGQRPAWPGHPG